MTERKPKRISGKPCPECGKSGAEVLRDGLHRCRYCGTRWHPDEKRCK